MLITFRSVHSPVFYLPGQWNNIYVHPNGSSLDMVTIWKQTRGKFIATNPYLTICEVLPGERAHCVNVGVNRGHDEAQAEHRGQAKKTRYNYDDSVGGLLRIVVVIVGWR
jgi:hypothetical protein